MPKKDTPGAPEGATLAILGRMQGRILIRGARRNYYAPATSETTDTAVVALVDDEGGGLRFTITVAGYGRRISDAFPVHAQWLNLLSRSCDEINALGINWDAPDSHKLGPVLRRVAIACQHAWMGDD